MIDTPAIDARRLVDDVRQATVAIGTAMPIEHQLPIPQDHHRQVVGRQVHQQRIPRR